MKKKFFFAFFFFVSFLETGYSITFGGFKNPKAKENSIKFTENKGQLIDDGGNLCSDILFSGEGAGAKVFLRKGGISYVMTRTEGIDELERSKMEMESNGVNPQKINQMVDSMRSKLPLSLQRIDMDFVGSNKEATILKEDPSETKFNYYLGHCPMGIIGVSAYKQVTYQSIYPNININFYGGKAAGMEYDFVVNPGGNPEDIQIKYSGAESINLTAEGKLLIKTQVGEIKEWIPSTYQIINGKKVDVASRYELNESAIRFHVDDYDKTQPLIIDPWCTWITYYGGNNDEWGVGISADSTGNIFISGRTCSINFPVLLGFQMNLLGTSDAYISKFSQYGNLLWATYYGGSANDGAIANFNDRNGNVIITGSTLSSDFPVQSGFQMVIRGSQNVFVVKLNSFGIRLWATYYGGNSYDWVTAIATDTSGNIFITGHTQSTNFPVQSGFQMTLSNIYAVNAFVVKFDSFGSRLWATYYGGVNNMGGVSYGNGITTDISGNVFITGWTDETSFPVLAGFQMSYGGTNDAFVVKFDGSGTRLWATYYGGSSSADYGTGITTDHSGNVFITGYTASTDFPVLSGIQMTYGGGYSDAFVVKFNGSGTRLWATYYGGGDRDMALGIATDFNGNSYIAGDTYGGNFPASVGACQQAYAGSIDVFFLSFDSLGNRNCSTYMGGNLQDNAGFIAISGSHAYVAGSTRGGFPVTLGSYQTASGGGFDAFVAQIPLDCSCTTTLSVNTSSNLDCSSQCSGTATAMPSCGTPPFAFLWNDGQTTQTAVGLCVGTYTVNVTDAASALVIATVVVASNPLPVPVITGDTSICVGQNSVLNGLGGGSYSWNTGATTSSITVLSTSTTTYTLTVTNASGCSDTISKTVTVNPLPVPVITGDTSICVGQNSILNGSGGGSYSWNTGVTTSSITVLPTYTTTYTLTVTNASGCSDTISKTVTVNPLPVPVVIGNTTICVGQSTILNASGANTYSWTPSTGLNTTTGATVTANPTNSTTYTVTGILGSCSDSINSTIIVNPSLALTISPSSVSICVGSSTILTASGATSYSWSPVTGLSSTIGSTVTAYPNISTTYTVTGDSGSCTGTQTVDVNVSPTLTLSVTPPASSVCVGDSTGLTANGATTYAWTPAVGLSSTTGVNVTAAPMTTTTYTVTGYNGICDSTATVTVTVNPIPIVNAGADVTIFYGDSINLNATGAGIYSWIPTIGLNCDSCQSPIAKPLTTTIYCVTGSNMFGCSATDCFTITVNSPDIICGEIFIPTAFSPDNNGANEMECVYGNCIETMEFCIYDRWGEKVFETSDSKLCWDGLYNGKLLNTSVFVYYFNATLITGEKITRKGNITLVR